MVDYVNVVCPGGAGAGRRRLGAGGRGAAGTGAGRAGRRARAAQAHHQAGRRPGACPSSWGYLPIATIICALEIPSYM